ncbi:hypothetical protein [Saccharopolyspora spinosa]|uniref:Uncharacterized protein n=1 Tax=Saccharopolyspora spinosa TaxID=60894 RepID=A0A2N3Y792_SACSN|nr:hypothetical protein [Saccharopolyspora spinosa]PKW18812.1 hypothetical protein A8926_6941 [Saccharopolyspora spinosa]
MSVSAAKSRRIDDAVVGAACWRNANVIMQLARPGVGYGVVESRVESGLHGCRAGAAPVLVQPHPLGLAPRHQDWSPVGLTS